MKTDRVFGPNENTGVADRRMAGHPVLLPDWNAVSTKRFPWKSRIPIRSRQAREEKPHTYTHKRTKPKKLHKNLNFAKWQQSKRDTKRCMLHRTTKLNIRRGDVLSAWTMAASLSVSGALPVRLLLNHMLCD
jgi:hypothetical protein